MATTTNYSWTTPDDTYLVKDGASAIRTLGSAIDTSFAADQGDLLLGGTSDIFEPLAIGAATTVLTSDGTTASWVAPAGGGKTWTLLNAGGTALTGAQTITVSGISDIEDLMIFIVQASSASASSLIALRFNCDTAANYGNVGFEINPSGTYSASNYGIAQNTANDRFNLSTMSNNANSQVSGGVWVSGGKSTGIKAIMGNAGAGANGGTSQTLNSQIGFYSASAAITSVSVVSSSGNFDNGTLYVYGA